MMITSDGDDDIDVYYFLYHYSYDGGPHHHDTWIYDDNDFCGGDHP